MPTIYSASRSLCLLCHENSTVYGINQQSVLVTGSSSTFSKDGSTHNLSNGLPNRLLAQSSNDLSNNLSSRLTTESLNGLSNGISKEIKTSGVSQSWSNHFKLPHIGAVYRENRLVTAQASCKSDQTQRNLLKQDVVLKNVTFAFSSEVTTQVMCSCTDEICIKCFHLDGHALQLPAKFSVERVSSGP